MFILTIYLSFTFTITLTVTGYYCYNSLVLVFNILTLIADSLTLFKF